MHRRKNAHAKNIVAPRVLLQTVEAPREGLAEALEWTQTAPGLKTSTRENSRYRSYRRLESHN